MSIRQVIRQEILARRENIQGTVVRDKKLVNYGIGTSPVWVCDVDIGKNRILKDVAIKQAADGSRFFAQRNQVVLLRRNSQGRYEVIGPGDKKISVAKKNIYDYPNSTPDDTQDSGFTTIVEPFSYYRGDLPGTPNSGLWGTPGFPKIRVVDQDGNDV